MKRSLSLLLSLPFWLFSCEEGVFGPRQPDCLETRQILQSGSTIERTYEGDDISEILTYSPAGELQSVQGFTYGSDGRIAESQNYNGQRSPTGLLLAITYNDKGKWVKATSTGSNGVILTYAATYDAQDRIVLYTSSTDRAGVVTVNQTVDYEWEGGNNTRLISTSSTFEQVLEYEYDLNRENKRRKEQEKTAFLAIAVAHNRNMVKRVINRVTTGGTTTETETTSAYQYNAEGYPTRLTVSRTAGTAPATTTITNFEYSCD